MYVQDSKGNIAAFGVIQNGGRHGFWDPRRGSYDATGQYWATQDIGGTFGYWLWEGFSTSAPTGAADPATDGRWAYDITVKVTGDSYTYTVTSEGGYRTDTATQYAKKTATFGPYDLSDTIKGGFTPYDVNDNCTFGVTAYCAEPLHMIDLKVSNVTYTVTNN